MLERFRQAGVDAEPVVIGARRRPEAVVLSYERYLQLAGGRERVRSILERQAAESASLPASDEALELANRELHAMRHSRRRRQ
jgi:PHD/YefM family antitoxin component YafN of YafNO toxin-antitoxin module